MAIREFNEDTIPISLLERKFIEQSLFEKIHENTVIVCHDILIRCKGPSQEGILLSERLDEPAKNILYPVGGRLLRGVSIEDSIHRKVKVECGLDIHNITNLSVERTFFKTDPFSHEGGTDTLNLVYIADGVGIIKLNTTLTNPVFITKDSYKGIRPKLSPYNQAILDIVDEKNLW